jgi:hypothetical protein
MEEVSFTEEGSMVEYRPNRRLIWASHSIYLRPLSRVFIGGISLLGSYRNNSVRTVSPGPRIDRLLGYIE